jgi:hypothetical protein
MMPLPRYWMFIEEMEGSFVFENIDHNFNVYIDYDAEKAAPYIIGYEQLEGDFEIIDAGDTPFTTTAATESEAIEKAMMMMEFINLKLHGAKEE